LYARFGVFKKNLCFAGHVDVVPPGDGWAVPPFCLTEKNGNFYGRGANDMKGPLAACLAAISDFVNERPNISLSLMLTSDEEVMGGNGTKKLVTELLPQGEEITGCILCESCSPHITSGSYIKIGCRGSLNVDFVSQGAQVHVVNGKILGNHIQRFISFLHEFLNIQLDSGSSEFPASSMEITSIDVANITRNVIPSVATAKINIRFNNLWNFEKLEQFIRERIPKNVTVSFERFENPTICSDQNFIHLISESITKSSGYKPEIGSLGGNSDAIYIKKITNVVEVGSPISGAHIVDEYISAEDLRLLRKIYYDIMVNFENHYR
jgi:succinyl-diaminopimelate desuccinylase